MFSKDLANRIEKALALATMSRTLLAEVMGVDYTLLSKWARGHHMPTAENLALLASATNVDGHWLLTGEGSPTGRTKPLFADPADLHRAYGQLLDAVELVGRTLNRHVPDEALVFPVESAERTG